MIVIVDTLSSPFTQAINMLPSPPGLSRQASTSSLSTSSISPERGQPSLARLESVVSTDHKDENSTGRLNTPLTHVS